jgi:hypothetical protein
MKEIGYVHPLLKFSIKEPAEGDRKISYSQFSMYSKCPKSWELAYVKKLRTTSQNINTIFGTALHETLQTYLTILYTESVKNADRLPLEQMLMDNLKSEYKDAVEKGMPHFSSPAELSDYYNDGVEILNYIKRKRSIYFSTKNTELVGIELPIYHTACNDNNAIMMLGYLDVVIRDTVTDEYTIIDIKTSLGGWNKYQKADKVKVSQLVVYKEYLARQFGIDIDKINIEYFIVKRKLIDGAMFPQKRIQQFSPASGRSTRNKVNSEIASFIKTCFNADGTYKENQYVAIAGKGAKHCRYCEFSELEDLCPKKNRIKQ